MAKFGKTLNSLVYCQKYKIQQEASCTISADNLSLFFSAAFLNSSMLMFPLASVPTETIFIPHIAALAGFVPCAETGIMQTLR